MPARILPSVHGLSPFSNFDTVTSAGNVITSGSFVGNGSGITYLSPTNIVSSRGVFGNLVCSNLTVTSIEYVQTIVNNVSIISNNYAGNGALLTGLASSQIAGLSSSATVDATNASNLSSGTLANARLPAGISVTSVTGTHYGSGAALTGLPVYPVPWVYNNTSVFANISTTANVNCLGNLLVTGAVSGGFFYGNGAFLSGILATGGGGGSQWSYGNSSGQAANVFVSAQVAVLGNLCVSGNVVSSALSTSRLGVGTAAPDCLVNIVSSVGTKDLSIYKPTMGNNASTAFFWFGKDATNNAEFNYCYYGNTGDYMAFNMYGGNPVVISKQGNLGVGTAAPQTAIQVVGTVTATSFAGSGAGLTGVPASLSATYVTFVAPSYVGGTGTAMASVSLTAGTWILVGGIGVTTTNQGNGLFIDFSIASGAIASTQPGYTTVITSVTGLQYLTTTVIIHVGSTTTYYMNAQYNGTASSWSASNNTTVYFRYIQLA